MISDIRTRIGLTLAITGGLLLSFAGSQYALGAVRAGQARQIWDAAEARRAVANAQATGLYFDMAHTPVVGSPVARLIIPRIDLDQIVLEGVAGDELNAGPGHVPGSAIPGRAGNSVISAHRDRHFNRFAELTVGDTVTTDLPGRRTVWVIVRRQIVGKDEPALFRSSDIRLTLTTCWPIRYLGPAPERLILTAEPVPPSGPG